MRKTIPGSVLVLGFLALMATGCGSRFSDYCKTLQTCNGGNDDDVAACEDAADGAYSEAQDYGCGDAAGVAADCANKSITCSALDACAVQEAAVEACECAASATCKKK